MSVLTQVPEPNIWEEICKEFQAKRPPFKEDDNTSVCTVKENYDPSKTTPVFFGKMYASVGTDCNSFREYDAAVSHPACVGYAFVDKPPCSPPPSPPPAPNKKSCSPREYLEHYIFPTLLPALEQMLYTAKTERCFERKRTKFNALDFLTEHLYKKNPDTNEREKMTLMDIPFVQEWLKDHPRPPLPKSLLWSEEEATLIIQSFWRGYKVRREPDIQELRQWQREWRAENENVSQKVNKFWAKQMPEDGSAAECAAESPAAAAPTPAAPTPAAPTQDTIPNPTPVPATQ